MCKPTTSNGTAQGVAVTGPSAEPIHVVVAGAGPAGLLATILLLRRNETNSNSSPKYRVTLVDAGRDYGTLTPDQLKKNRSWMIGLANQGLTAIRTATPNLYDDYVAQVGVPLTSNSLHLGSREIKFSTEDSGEGYIVDRNFICASLARYLHEKHGMDKFFARRYDTKILYVDGENRRMLVREGANGNCREQYLTYDYVLGCDGIRSSVRDAILHTHRDFECSVQDIFAKFKAVHVECPPNVDPSSVHVFPNGIPKMNGIALPETGNQLNISFGHMRNAAPDDGLCSDDVAVVADYVKKNFQGLQLVDYDDFARQWVDQPWNTTGQVHCNYYHSLKNHILLMGDAAHATSPSIGQGMNTALQDASVLNRLLDELKDNWETVLPAFSDERVKEGRALTDLAYYAYCQDTKHAMMFQLAGVTRMVLHKVVPWFVEEDPMIGLGRGGKLSVTYNDMIRLGILPRVRAINDRIRREHFEEQSGMVTYGKKKRGVLGALSNPWMMALVAASAVSYCAVQT